MIRDAKVLEALVRDLHASMPDAMFMVDSAGSILFANPLLEQMLGYGQGELSGLPIGAVIPERFRGAHQGHCADYFERPRTRAMGVGLSLHALHKNGAELPVEISLSPIDTDAGVVVVGTVRDITESEERYRAIFAQVAVGVVHSSTEGRFLNVNPKFCELTGFGNEELMQRSVYDLMHPDDVGMNIEARHEIVEGARPDFSREARLLCKSGAAVWAHITTSLVRGAGGRPLHFISVVHDISSQKSAEEELVKSEERFRAVVEQSISGACIIGHDGRVIYANPRLVSILGYESYQPLVDRPILDFVAPEDHQIIRDNMRERMGGDTQHARYHFRAIRKDGTHVVLGAHGNPGTYRDQPVLITTVQDLTEIVRAENEVARTMQKLKGAIDGTIEVVSRMGHMRDPYTHGHEHRVGEIATAIGVEMGLSEDRLEGLKIAGYLHDVGKIGVPAEILSKPSRLTKPEFDLIKEHAQQSYEILKDIEFPWPVAKGAWQHHERLDGSGYPQGLKGEEIILEARIIAVADTVEAMASHRPYRPGLGIEKALAEIERGRGTTYCPMAADNCLRLFRDKGYVIPQ